MPDYLAALQCAIDSSDIPLNVSRSHLQIDKTVRQLSTHIAKKVADKLTSTYAENQEEFFAIWPEIETIIKLGIIQDEKFRDKALDCLVWKNTKGTWTTLDAYLERNLEAHKDKVFYTIESHQDSSFLSLYQEKGIEVLISSSPLDTALMSTLEKKRAPLRFKRIDGDIDAAILDSSKDCTLLDSEGKTFGTKIAELISAKLGKEQIQVEAKSLASDALAGFIVLEEESRRMRDYFAMSKQQIPPSLFDKKTFVVNTNNKLITRLPALNDKDPELAKDLVLQLYELSLLSQREFEPSQVSGFVERSERLLQKILD